MMHSMTEQIAIKNDWAGPIFCAVHETLKFPEKARTRSEGWRYNYNSLQISAIGQKFTGMMHSTMKQIAP